MTNEKDKNKKMVTIIVEGTPHEWPKGKITYAEVVALVPDCAQLPENSCQVTYKRGNADKPQGILSPGSSVEVKDGMIFNVSPTGQS